MGTGRAPAAACAVGVGAGEAGMGFCAALQHRAPEDPRAAAEHDMPVTWWAINNKNSTSAVVQRVLRSQVLALVTQLECRYPSLGASSYCLIVCHTIPAVYKASTSDLRLSRMDWRQWSASILNNVYQKLDPSATTTHTLTPD